MLHIDICSRLLKGGYTGERGKSLKLLFSANDLLIRRLFTIVGLDVVDHCFVRQTRILSLYRLVYGLYFCTTSNTHTLCGSPGSKYSVFFGTFRWYERGGDKKYWSGDKNWSEDGEENTNTKNDQKEKNYTQKSVRKIRAKTIGMENWHKKIPIIIH